MPCEINNNSNYDVSEIEDLLQDLFSFSKHRFNFKENPVLNLISDENNTSPLGTWKLPFMLIIVIQKIL